MRARKSRSLTFYKIKALLSFGHLRVPSQGLSRVFSGVTATRPPGRAQELRQRGLSPRLSALSGLVRQALPAGVWAPARPEPSPPLWGAFVPGTVSGAAVAHALPPGGKRNQFRVKKSCRKTSLTTAVRGHGAEPRARRRRHPTAGVLVHPRLSCRSLLTAGCAGCREPVTSEHLNPERRRLRQPAPARHPPGLSLYLSVRESPSRDFIFADPVQVLRPFLLWAGGWGPHRALPLLLPRPPPGVNVTVLGNRNLSFVLTGSWLSQDRPGAWSSACGRGLLPSAPPAPGRLRPRWQLPLASTTRQVGRPSLSRCPSLRVLLRSLSRRPASSSSVWPLCGRAVEG